MIPSVFAKQAPNIRDARSQSQDNLLALVEFRKRDIQGSIQAERTWLICSSRSTAP